MLLSAFSWLFSLLLFCLSAFFFIQVSSAFFYRKSRSVIPTSLQDVSQKKVAVLIPAHNESLVIRDTLDALMPQLQSSDEVVVVADNCSDETAEIARKYQVTVLERQHDTDKGKGYALDFGLNYLRSKQMDVIIMLDADCLLQAGGRDVLVQEALLAQKPIQALYLMKNAVTAPTVPQKIAEFAWLIKNKIRPAGAKKINSPCQLMGTGMAFPASLIFEAELASGCIVEDMKLGLDFAVDGFAPEFTDRTEVISYFPESDEVGEGQRSRWIQGHMDMIVKYAPVLLIKSLTTLDYRRLLMALDLMIPPLVMFLMMTCVAIALAVLTFLFTGNAPVLLSILTLLLLVLSVYLSWYFEGKKIISGHEFKQGVLSKLSNLSIYSQFFTHKRKEWNKTSRK